MNKSWARLAVTIGAAAFLGSILTLELYFNNRAEMGRADVIDISIPQFGRAAMWAMLASLILRLREKMPLNRGHWFGGSQRDEHNQHRDAECRH